MALSLSDIESWEQKADRLKAWSNDEPENWIKANNKRFPFNKALGQSFVLHEIDTSIEPLKGFDDILRRLRWEKPNTADVLQKKCDEFLSYLRQGFALIEGGDDTHGWSVIVLRTYALDLTGELRNIAKIARAELTGEKPTDTEQDKKAVTLLQFMQRYCEEQKLPLLKCRRKSLNDAHNREAIKLPELARRWKSGQSKYYKASDLIEKWPSYCDALPNLPFLKQES